MFFFICSMVSHVFSIFFCFCFCFTDFTTSKVQVFFHIFLFLTIHAIVYSNIIYHFVLFLFSLLLLLLILHNSIKSHPKSKFNWCGQSDFDLNPMNVHFIHEIIPFLSLNLNVSTGISTISSSLSFV